MGSSPQATALPLKGLSSRQLQYACSTQPGTPLERKKSECHRQDLEDWLRTSVTASYNVWLTFPVEEKQESEKGQGWCGGCVKPNPMKKLNFWFLYTEKKKKAIRFWFCLLYMGFLDIKKLWNATSYQRVVFFLVLHGKDCAACSKSTSTATSLCFRDGIRCIRLWARLSEKWDLGF